jgi:hypothetical protein
VSSGAFDRVILNGVELSAAEFLARPLRERVQAMLAGQLTFYLGDVAIDLRSAVEAERKTKAEKQP